MTEIEIKIQLVDFLIREYPDSIIAAEVPFLFGERRADIVMLENDIATVFEIKSALDSMSRLTEQLDNYRNFFDFCYVVGEPCNIQEIRKVSPATTGLISVSTNEVKVLRKAYQFKRLDKLTLASVLPVNMLKTLTKSKLKSSQIDLAKDLVKQHSLTDLKKINRDHLRNAYQHCFKLMKSEIGRRITADDIHTISQRIPHLLVDTSR